MKRAGPEHSFQVRLMAYLEQNARSELHWFAIPNGELRHHNVAMRLKAEGVKPGTADICILLEQGRSAWLELKAKGGRLSDEQRGFSARCGRLGHLWATVKTLQQAIEILKLWGVLRSNADLEAA